MMHLQGRAFTRLNQFHALPVALQHEANALVDHLTGHAAEVFDKHLTLKLKSVYGVRAKHLLHAIDEWLARQHASHVTGSTGSHLPVAGAGATSPMAIPVASAGGHHQYDHHTTSSHAKTLLEALVLKGFLAPDKEEKHVGVTATSENLTFKDSELLVPLGKHVQGPANIELSVWDLLDGAVFAGALKRKAGPLEPLTHGQDVYAVVNARSKTLTLFKTDVSRKPIAQLEAAAMLVAFDATRYDYGVKVWTALNKELLNAGSQQESDALVHALLAIGASHEKRHFLDDQLSPSELHDPMTEHHAHHAHSSTERSESLRDKIGNLFKKDDHDHEGHATTTTRTHGTHSPEPAHVLP